MFDALGNRFRAVFSTLRGEVRLTPETVESALRQIRLALLEADVNFKVVKAFIDRVRDRAIDRAVLASLTPAQQVVGIVRQELLALFGEEAPQLTAAARRPQVIMLLGLQGSGKTTTSAKLGRWLARQGRHPLLVSTDVRRPRRSRSSTWWVGRPACAFTIRRMRPIPPSARGPRSPRRGLSVATWSSSTPPAGCTSMTR